MKKAPPGVDPNGAQFKGDFALGSAEPAVPVSSPPSTSRSVGIDTLGSGKRKGFCGECATENPLTRPSESHLVDSEQRSFCPDGVQWPRRDDGDTRNPESGGPVRLPERPRA